MIAGDKTTKKKNDLKITLSKIISKFILSAESRLLFYNFDTHVIGNI